MILNTFEQLHQWWSLNLYLTTNKVRRRLSIECRYIFNHYLSAICHFHMILNTFGQLHHWFSINWDCTANEVRRWFRIDWRKTYNPYLQQFVTFAWFWTLLNSCTNGRVWIDIELQIKLEAGWALNVDTFSITICQQYVTFTWFWTLLNSCTTGSVLIEIALQMRLEDGSALTGEKHIIHICSNLLLLHDSEHFWSVAPMVEFELRLHCKWS